MNLAILTRSRWDGCGINEYFKEVELISATPREAIIEARMIVPPPGFEYLGTRNSNTWIDMA